MMNPLGSDRIIIEEASARRRLDRCRAGRAAVRSMAF
jgi:hypothetical protein